MKLALKQILCLCPLYQVCVCISRLCKSCIISVYSGSHLKCFSMFSTKLYKFITILGSLTNAMKYVNLQFWQFPEAQLEMMKPSLPGCRKQNIKQHKPCRDLPESCFMKFQRCFYNLKQPVVDVAKNMCRVYWKSTFSHVLFSDLAQIFSD